MSCDALILHVGSCLSFEVTFTNGSGEPVDITTDTLSIEDPSVPIFSQIEITKTDAEKGRARIMLHEDKAAEIPLGVKSSFRIGKYDGECIVTTNEIWVNHK